MKLLNEFIGTNEYDKVLNFLPGDTEELFLENLKTADNDWYYRNADITYSLNDNGHRCKNIRDIDLSNYVLFGGCSHTTGIGLELEKTYPYLISNMLGYDYYNLSMPGAGIDVMEYNILTWLGKISKKPKIVFIQLPDHTRFCTHNKHIGADFFIESGSWATDKGELDMIVNCEDIGFFNARKHFTYENMFNVIDVPIVKINVFGQNNQFDYDVKARGRDLARDLCHLGINSNLELTKNIYSFIQMRYPELSKNI